MLTASYLRTSRGPQLPATPSSMSILDLRRAVVGIAIGAVMWGTAGCGTSSDNPGTPPAGSVSPSPTSTLSAQQQAAVDKAWAAYQALNEIYVKAAQTGVYDFADDRTKRALYPYAGGTHLSDLERDLDSLQERGLIRTGTPTTTLLRVVAVTDTSVTVEVCLDNTGTDTVNKQTGQSVVASGQNQRYPATMRAGLYPDGSWRWVEAQANRSASC